MNKSTKWRACPAVQREINPAECGENRISRYHCPVECAFNPFSPASYASFSEIEAGVIRKSLDWFLDCAPDRAAALRQLDRLAGQDRIHQHAYQVAEVFYKRDANGQTCAERWAAAGFPGLKNDERVVQRAAMQLRPRLMEVHRVLDDLRIEAVDLFEPEPRPFLVCDRALAAQACRFTTLLGWFFPLPHYWRTFGFAIMVSPLGPFDALEVTAEIISHLGGPADRGAWTEWFGGNYARFSDALTAVSLARRGQMFAGLDAEYGKAVYELRAPFAACRDVLDGISAVAREALAEGERNEGLAEARVWFDATPDQTAGEMARPVLGRVLLGQAFWRLEAIGAERLARLRRQFEGAFGEQVRFTGERRDDLVAHLKSKEPKYDLALVPPRLLESPAKFLIASSRVAVNAAAGTPEEIESGLALEQDRAWLDGPVPALENKTPREAARDPALRPKLIGLLKERVRNGDENNLERGGSADINWLLEELGATEIIFAPPPPRAPARRGVPLSELAGQEDFDALEDLDPWPLLPPRPFTREEAVEGLLKALTEFENLDEAEAAMEAAGGFLIEDVRAVVGEMLSDAEHTFLAPFLLETWFAFVPPGCYGPDIEPTELHAAFGRQLGSLADLPATTGEEATGLFLLEQGPQPAMLLVLAGQLLDQWVELSARHKVPADHRTLALIIMKAVIEVLDARCREAAP